MKLFHPTLVVTDRVTNCQHHGRSPVIMVHGIFVCGGCVLDCYDILPSDFSRKLLGFEVQEYAKLIDMKIAKMVESMSHVK